MSDFIEILSIVTAIQLIIFCGFVFFRKNKTINHYLLAAFLLSNAVFIIGFMIHHYVITYPVLLMPFLYFGKAFGLLFGPLILLYSKSITLKNFRLKKSELLHLIPFLIYIIVTVVYFHSKSFETKMMLIDKRILIPIEINITLTVSLNIQILIYVILAIKKVLSYQKQIEQVHSEIESIKLAWLNLVLAGFVVMWSIDILHFIGDRINIISDLASSTLSVLSLGINFVFAILIMFKGLNQPQYFGIGLDREEKERYFKSTLNKTKSEEHLLDLIGYMESEKPYLNPTLTINELAEKINILPKFLSQTINQNLNQNFYEFINDYRIKYAMQLLSSTSKTDYTVLEIAYECGFNSKSVFNSAFKKITNTTPTEFRKTQKLIIA